MVDVLVTDAPGGEIDRGLLATSELSHADAIDSLVGRGEYLAARTWLRHTLALYLRYPPSLVRLEGGRAVRDQVVSPITDLSLSFSYTGSLAVLATAFRQDIGVAAKRLGDDADLPKRVSEEFTLDEQLKVANSHDPARTFWKLAVRKRALAKSVGEELAEKTKELDVSGLSPVEHLGQEIIDIYIADDVVAAVAVPPGAQINVILDETAPNLGIAAGTERTFVRTG
jgi:phosphopantetheinyl transferase